MCRSSQLRSFFTSNKIFFEEDKTQILPSSHINMQGGENIFSKKQGLMLKRFLKNFIFLKRWYAIKSVKIAQSGLITYGIGLILLQDFFCMIRWKYWDNEEKKNRYIQKSFKKRNWYWYFNNNSHYCMLFYYPGYYRQGIVSYTILYRK